MSDQVLPLLRLTSILNWAPRADVVRPGDGVDAPTGQVTSVLGEVTVTAAATRENVPLTALAAGVPLTDTRTIAFVAAGARRRPGEAAAVGRAGRERRVAACRRCD